MRRRQQRLSDLLKEELSQILLRRTHDPRFSMCSITDVVLSSDYRHAKVYVGVLGSLKEREECVKALRAAEGFFRRELGRLNLRQVPTLDFHYDTGAEYSQHIDELLKSVKEESNS